MRTVDSRVEDNNLARVWVSEGGGSGEGRSVHNGVWSEVEHW